MADAYWTLERFRLKVGGRCWALLAEVTPVLGVLPEAGSDTERSAGTDSGGVMAIDGESIGDGVDSRFDPDVVTAAYDLACLPS